MTNTDVIAQIISEVGSDMTYMLPIIGVLAGIKLVLDLLFDFAYRISDRKQG